VSGASDWIMCRETTTTDMTTCDRAGPIWQSCARFCHAAALRSRAMSLLRHLRQRLRADRALSIFLKSSLPLQAMTPAARLSLLAARSALAHSQPLGSQVNNQLLSSLAALGAGRRLSALSASDSQSSRSVEQAVAELHSLQADAPALLAGSPEAANERVLQIVDLLFADREVQRSAGLWPLSKPALASILNISAENIPPSKRVTWGRDLLRLTLQRLSAPAVVQLLTAALRAADPPSREAALAAAAAAARSVLSQPAIAALRSLQADAPALLAGDAGEANARVQRLIDALFSDVYQGGSTDGFMLGPTPLAKLLRVSADSFSPSNRIGWGEPFITFLLGRFSEPATVDGVEAALCAPDAQSRDAALFRAAAASRAALAQPALAQLRRLHACAVRLRTPEGILGNPKPSDDHRGRLKPKPKLVESDKHALQDVADALLADVYSGCMPETCMIGTPALARVFCFSEVQSTPSHRADWCPGLISLLWRRLTPAAIDGLIEAVECFVEDSDPALKSAAISRAAVASREELALPALAKLALLERDFDELYNDIPPPNTRLDEVEILQLEYVRRRLNEVIDLLQIDVYTGGPSEGCLIGRPRLAKLLDVMNQRLCPSSRAKWGPGIVEHVLEGFVDPFVVSEIQRELRDYVRSGECEHVGP